MILLKMWLLHLVISSKRLWVFLCKGNTYIYPGHNFINVACNTIHMFIWSVIFYTTRCRKSRKGRDKIDTFLPNFKVST